MRVHVSLITHNLWRTVRWPQRAEALAAFLAVVQPDIYCVQELQPETCVFLEEHLPNHKRVVDAFPGWTVEGNIFWDKAQFTLIEFGAEDVGIVEPMRRMFWVRLHPKGKGYSILVATVHLTFKATLQELTTGTSPRLAQAHKIVAALNRLSNGADPVFMMGDFNDASHPTFILNDAGFIDCFTALGEQAPATSPTYQSSNIPVGRPTPSQTLDWITARDARVVSARVPRFQCGGVWPSDHYPVQAIYEL